MHANGEALHVEQRGGGGEGGGERERGGGNSDVILGDGALLYIANMMLFRAPLIPATRWSCSQPPADSDIC